MVLCTIQFTKPKRTKIMKVWWYNSEEMKETNRKKSKKWIWRDPNEKTENDCSRSRKRKLKNHRNLLGSKIIENNTIK